MNRPLLLSALALALESHEAPGPALEHLVAGDTDLAPWAASLARALDGGQTLGHALRTHGLLSRRQAAALEASRHPARLLATWAETRPRPWLATALVWAPVTLTLAGLAGAALGTLALEPLRLAVMFGEFSWRPWTLLAMGLALVPALVLTLALLRQIRGLRWLTALWFPTVQERLALVHLTEGGFPPPGPLARWWASTRLGFRRPNAPPWDPAWRAWWGFIRWKLPAGYAVVLKDLPSPEERLKALQRHERTTVYRQLDVAVDASRPWWVAGMFVSFGLGLMGGLTPPAHTAVEAITEGLKTHATSPLATLFFLVPLGIVVLIGILRGLLQLVQPLAPEPVVRTVASALADALDQRGDLAEALDLASIHLPLPWAWHLQRAARRVRAGDGVDPVGVLIRHRLLPGRLAASGRAAQALGAPALATWFRQVAEAPSWHADLRMALAPAVSMSLALLGVMVFIKLVIVTKWELVSKELGIPMDVRLQWLNELPLPWLLVVLPAAGLVVWGISWAAWAGTRREALAQALLVAVRQGRPEADLAAAVGTPAPDFPAIARAAGWPGITTPTALAQAAATAAHRRRARHLIGRTVISLAMPVVLAIPVLVLATGIIGTIVGYMDALARWEP